MRAGHSLLFLALVAAFGCAGAPRRPPPAIERSRLLLAAGDEARALGDAAGAARAYARALASARAGDDLALAADAGYRLGVSLLGAGEPREAAIQLEDAAGMARAVGAKRLAARANLALARARQEADGGQAIVREALARALETARAAEDPAAEALARVGLAALSDDIEAPAHLDAAQALAGGDPAVAAPLALQRARRAERAGETSAGELYRQAADRYRALEDAVGLFEALAGAARALDRSPGAAAEAAELHRRTASAALRTGAEGAAAAELRLSAEACRRAGDAVGAARREAEAARLEQSTRAERHGRVHRGGALPDTEGQQDSTRPR